MVTLILAGCSSQVIMEKTAVPTFRNETETATIAATETYLPTFTLTHTPPVLPILNQVELVHIEFVDSTNGWGIAVNDKGFIARTFDGGESWFNATTAGAGQIGTSTELFVLDDSHAWAIVPEMDFFQSVLFYTSDGGMSWKSQVAPFGRAQIQFLDVSNGFAMADRGAGAGSNAIGLFSTSDGGLTWTYIFRNDPTEPGASDSLPLEGIKNGMIFIDKHTGWITGSLPVAGDIYLYMTHDNGFTWAKQDIQLPSGYEDFLYIPHPPIFFGSTGILPLTIIKPDRTELTFYSSTDSGEHWNGNPASNSISSGRFTFADALHGWSWNGGGNIYFTKDGAQTWTKTVTNTNLSGKLNQIGFNKTASGEYVGWALSNLDENNQAQLYITSNQGLTWTQKYP
jgi:photosystem II stability/assembly factor-like uncharacterized protein